MNKFYLSFLFLAIALILHAQDEGEACSNPSKKTMKLIKSALNAKDSRSAVENFNAAIEADDANATAYYFYAIYVYETGLNYYQTQPNPALGNRSFKKAEELFSKTLNICSNYHANCSYYLGVINYTQKEMADAIKWFEEFKEYEHEDNDRYPEDYSKKLLDVTEVLEDLLKDQKIKSESVPFKPQIVRNVSTEKQEYFPMISPDNELIFYTRKLDRREYGAIKSKMVEEITFSRRADMLSDFDGGTPLQKPFNDGSVQSYGAATLSVDNKEMIICACKKEMVGTQAYMNCDLYSAQYVRSGAGGNDFSWTPLENMGSNINTPGGWEGQPSLSSDGNTLYYTVSRPDSRNNDIYVAKRDKDGTWGMAKPFDQINTNGKDKSPFLHQDSETLYFVSECTKERPGVGGLDIFYIRYENGSWTAPKNIGYPINSEADELGLFVSIDGTVAYYSSRVGGNWNIYSFELYEEARPKSVAVLKGELKDENGEPVKDAVIEIAYEDSEEVTQVKVNGDDGKYAAIVKTEKSQDVMVTVKKEGHAFDTKLIAKEEFKQKDVAVRDKNLSVKKLKVGEAYTIKEILYATNSASLTPSSKFILKGFARFLRENPTLTVSIQGHTDDVGDATENLDLSERRAHGVEIYLQSLGIEAQRLSAKGYGESMPKVENSSSFNRSLNRRTDFFIEGL